MQEIPSELVEGARKGNKDAVVEVLAIHYPLVWRMATGLTGRSDVGRGVAKFVMQQSLGMLESWKDDGAPTRWFLHHTVLTVRRTQKHQPDRQNDVFLAGAQNEPGYVAFVRGMRTMPLQQREAFVLTHCERLDIRTLAVAMDCSTTAAANHLQVATDHLVMLSQKEFDAHVARMRQAYQALSPDEELSLKDIRRNVRRWLLPWLIGRLVRPVVALVLLIGAAWGGLWVWRIVSHSLVD